MPLRQVRPEVPEPLESLVPRLLAKDPQHRPAGAQDVYRELAALLPVPAQVHHAPLGPMNPTQPFLRPHAPRPDRGRHTTGSTGRARTQCAARGQAGPGPGPTPDPPPPRGERSPPDPYT